VLPYCGAQAAFSVLSVRWCVLHAGADNVSAQEFYTYCKTAKYTLVSTRSTCVWPQGSSSVCLACLLQVNHVIACLGERLMNKKLEVRILELTR
jgi:hypothetical protein